MKMTRIIFSLLLMAIAGCGKNSGNHQIKVQSNAERLAKIDLELESLKEKEKSKIDSFLESEEAKEAYAALSGLKGVSKSLKGNAKIEAEKKFKNQFEIVKNAVRDTINKVKEDPLYVASAVTGIGAADILMLFKITEHKIKLEIAKEQQEKQQQERHGFLSEDRADEPNEKLTQEQEEIEASNKALSEIRNIFYVSLEIHKLLEERNKLTAL